MAKKLNTNSNVYTIVYAAVIVVIVAFLLAFVSSALKPTQDVNVAIDKKQQILSALNMRGLETSAVEDTYAKVIKSDLIYGASVSDLKNDGTAVGSKEQHDQGGFQVQTKELTSDNRPLYIAEVEGQTKYVIPVKGQGLWGGIWGYIALNDDCTTIYGVYFSHESETAGLGARIVEDWFQQNFNGKKLFAGDDDSQVAFSIVKPGKEGGLDSSNYVNGITGATITSVGVHDMVQDGLQSYLDILKEYKK